MNKFNDIIAIVKNIPCCSFCETRIQFCEKCNEEFKLKDYIVCEKSPGGSDYTVDMHLYGLKHYHLNCYQSLVKSLKRKIRRDKYGNT